MRAQPASSATELPVGDLPWGWHTCQLYRDRRDLAELTAPFFAAGLAKNQRCLWITSAPLWADDAREALAALVPDLRACFERGQIEILDYEAFYRRAGRIDGSSLVQAWMDAEQRALADGFEGLRLSGNVSWLSADEWARFAEYEQAVHRAFHGRRIIALCSYPLAERDAWQLLDVMRNHDQALVPREGRWEAMTSATHVIASASRPTCEAPPAHREAPASQGVNVPPSHLVAQLEEARAALETEAFRRVRLETERTLLLEKERLHRVRAETASRHLARLQALTSALSSASSVEDVAGVVSSEISRAVASGRATLLLCARDGESAAAIDGSMRMALDGTCHASVALRTGIPRWADPSDGTDAVSFLPLAASTEPLGLLAWVRLGDALSLEERALLEDCARQVALALDRALLYEAARSERARAEQASRAKDEFLAMLGHELRNPLSPMLTALELMRMRDASALQRERAVIERQVTHMVRLVDDLLDVSRIARGKVALARAPIELAELASDALEITSPALEERAQELAMRVPASGLRVDADRARVVQVIVNLLTNASKFSPRGARIDLVACERAGHASLSIRDRGIGIDPALLPRVFDLFVQGKQMADRKNGGLGLGLAIARNIAELHGGSLSAHSEGLGEGSAFTLELPIVSADERAGTTQRARRSVRQSAAGRRILVVDDNEDAANLLRAMLERWGHEVRVAHDGPAALAIARSQRPQIALLDIGLPVMDGHELAGRLAETLADAPPKLVAVTGYGQESDQRRSYEAGFCRHLVKPVMPDHLHRVLDELVSS